MPLSQVHIKVHVTCLTLSLHWQQSRITQPWCSPAALPSSPDAGVHSAHLPNTSNHSFHLTHSACAMLQPSIQHQSASGAFLIHLQQTQNLDDNYHLPTTQKLTFGLGLHICRLLVFYPGTHWCTPYKDPLQLSVASMGFVKIWTWLVVWVLASNLFSSRLHDYAILKPVSLPRLTPENSQNILGKEKVLGPWSTQDLW